MDCLRGPAPVGPVAVAVQASAPKPHVNLKVVVVGDGGVGKTSMLSCFARDSFPSEHVPTVFDSETKEMIIDDRPVTLGLWDTAG